MADKIIISENTTVDNVDINYMGEIQYKKTQQNFTSGEEFNIKPMLDNPIGYSIAKDVFSVITKPLYYDDTFELIREEKQGSGLNQFFSSALAVNDFTIQQNLSGAAEDNTFDTLLSLTDVESDENYANIVLYSFTTKVRYTEASNWYWYYDNGNLSSVSNPTQFDENYYFYFKFLDGEYCNIIKELSGGSKYLTYNPSLSSFTFEDSEDETNSRFIYSHNTNSGDFILGIQNVGILGFSNSAELSAIDSSSFINEINNTFQLDNKNNLNSQESIKNSFMPYYGNKNDINQSFEVDNYGIYTHNFNSRIPNNSNYITLKNNIIYDEKYSIIGLNDKPHFRDYSCINSGIRGDSGYNNYILGYNTESYKYDFKPDKQTYFNVPFELGEGYSKININDTSLIQNGAIGGNSPLNSDKIYKKKYEYIDFKNTGETVGVDNAKYLCSWLWYNPLYPSQSVWLDRYYNPDVVNNFNALSEQGWFLLSSLESFSTTSGLVGDYETYFNEFNKDVGVFDVRSKLTIEPNCLYFYEHLGSETSKILYNELSSLKLDSHINEILDSENNFYLLTDSTGDDEEFTLNITLNNFDIDTFKGNKIFGNRTISLTVDKDFSPYTLTVDGTKINYYDFDYNFIKSLDLSSTIDDIIFTDDFNKFYVDCDGVIYTVESLDFITNETTTLSGNDTITDIKYYNQKLYLIDSSTNTLSSYSPELDVLEVETTTTDELFVVVDGEFYTGNGEYIDYGDSKDIYTLSSNQIFYKNISTPILSSDNIVDFYVDSDDILYVLKEDSIYKINNKTLTKVSTSAQLSATHTLSSFDTTRYQRDGVIYEYIDVYDKSGTDTIIHRYDKNLNKVDTLNRTIEGNIIKTKKRFNTKYLNNQLTFKVTLFDIFNYYKKGDVELVIDKSYIDESEKSIINFIFSNKYGTITVYFNGNLINIYKFDNEKYYFSNTLRDNKIFVGSTILNDEETIDSVVLSSNSDMISGSCDIEEISIFNKTFNYFDVINYNRVYRESPSAHLVVPIKKRSYIEEIAGFYNQNKNIRKSEYGSIDIYGAELTDNIQKDVKNEIDNLFEDTFINLRISDTTFK